jgi:uncharacterized protein (TIGR00645 family)
MIGQAIERIIFGSRWLLVPLYVTLALSLFELLVQAAVKLQSATVNFWTLGEEGVLLSVLAVVDLTLTASLVVIVIISGYTNFVTPVEMSPNDRRPHWVAEIDFGQLKLALMASIVAISAIKLLEGFMEISNLSDRELWDPFDLRSIGRAAGACRSDWLPLPRERRGLGRQWHRGTAGRLMELGERSDARQLRAPLSFAMEGAASGGANQRQVLPAG